VDPGTDHVTPYDRLALTDLQVEPLLLAGSHERELTALFGDDEYRQLRRLAAEAHARPLLPGAEHVLIVPGIMGSQLGIQRRAPLPDDILWLDPVDIGNGRLSALRLNEETARASGVIALGPVLHSYLKLKLRLRAAGFEPELHPYDWRLSLEASGRELAEKLDRYVDRRTLLVAHSMGGLVARVALRILKNRPARIVLLGTPQSGSFAAVQALRGTYAVVRKVARLDHRHDAEHLAQHVFSSFPSVYEMLPTAELSGAIDLFDPRAWPAQGPGPEPQLLQRASRFQSSLGPVDDGVALIVGVNQETVTAVEAAQDEFRYTITRRGDGTVPLACAQLGGARTYYTGTAHSELTRDPFVTQVLIELLQRGETSLLPTRWATRSRAEAKITDRELRLTHAGKVDWSRLGPDARRIYLQNLNDPPRLRLRIPSRPSR
jgi:pimeloyl-ACP methyl ester carboxylesterase